MTRDTPVEIKTALIAAYGLNPYGEPKFRVIWGGNAIDHLGLKYAHLPKGNESWHLERWVSPESFGPPDKWDEKEHGPYPSRGSYEHSLSFGPHITATAAAWVARAIVYGIEHYTPSQRMAALKRREELAQKAWDDAGNEILETTQKEMDSVTLPPTKGSGAYGLPTGGST